MYLNGVKGKDDKPIEYPVEVIFENEKVYIKTTQEMGNDGTDYYRLYFNGPQNGSGWFIWWGESYKETLKWSAEPQLDDASETITLAFADSGEGRGNVAQQLNIRVGGPNGDLPGDSYIQTEHLTISKSYPDTDPVETTVTDN